MYFDRVLPAAVMAAASLLATTASAHARLIAATPAAGSTVTATRLVTLSFSERMVPAFSRVEIVAATGARPAIATSVSDDGKTLVGTLSAPLAAGDYTVQWSIASGDGHRMTGNHAFTVR